MNTCRFLGSEIFAKVRSTSAGTPVEFEMTSRSTGSALPDCASLGSEDDGACGEGMALTVYEVGTRDNYVLLGGAFLLLKKSAQGCRKA